MTRTTALVLALSLLLLGGAWLWSRSLTADVPVPAVTQSAPAAPPPSFEPGVAPPPARPPPPGLAVTSPPPEPDLARPAPPPPPALPPDLTPEQLEIEGIVGQGLTQLQDERGGPANWRRAEKFFQRCLVLAPEEERCKEGIHQARLRLGPKVEKLAFPLVPVQDAPPPDPEE